MNLQPVILCGGSGTRLWPLSRHQYPKQLLTLDGSHSMLQATALRLTQGVGGEGIDVLPPLVVSNEEYRFVSAEQLRQVGVKPRALILEPFGRNTAPALTLAALYAKSRGDDPLLVAMPADHVMLDVDAFRAATRRGAQYAQEGRVVTFGIKPESAHTGYGYIQISDELAPGVSALGKFVEKPDQKTAAADVTDGLHLWNSGIFMVKASVWMNEISRTRPEIARICEAAFSGSQADHDFLRIGEATFAGCPAESIDYAVMEELPSAAAVVVSLSAGWSDVGAWSTLWEIGKKDGDGNVAHGDVHLIDSQGSLVFAQHRLVAGIGLEDVVVVETSDAVLVSRKDRLEQVKEVVARLKSQGRSECETHRKVHRPWGWYDSIDAGQRFQVKHIVVNPGAALSLQMHHHRAEHWVVVTGTARVTRGEEVFIVSENESTYIPLGVKHRLENPGKVPLEIIEIQSGPYLGEDDIVRFEDTYGRVK